MEITIQITSSLISPPTKAATMTLAPDPAWAASLSQAIELLGKLRESPQNVHRGLTRGLISERDAEQAINADRKEAGETWRRVLQLLNACVESHSQDLLNTRVTYPRDELEEAVRWPDGRILWDEIAKAALAAPDQQTTSIPEHTLTQGIPRALGRDLRFHRMPGDLAHAVREEHRNFALDFIDSLHPHALGTLKAALLAENQDLADPS